MLAAAQLHALLSVIIVFHVHRIVPMPAPGFRRLPQTSPEGPDKPEDNSCFLWQSVESTCKFSLCPLMLFHSIVYKDLRKIWEWESSFYPFPTIFSLPLLN